uniref:Uncharacterized protein n=1 Tax=Rhizophora mucronata TaxID=61149 RepID=A0A2P2PFF2_RHIMU
MSSIRDIGLIINDRISMTMLLRFL